MSQILELKYVKISELEPNPSQPRVGFDQTKLRELGDSIKASGLLQPIIVRKKGNKYQIIAGERRWRAARLIGIEKVPIIVKDTVEKKVLLESFIENLHREDLNSVERENAVYELWKSGEYKSHRELAEAIGYHDLSAVDEIIESKEFRKRVGKLVPTTASTTLISETKGLDDKTRAAVIQQAERGELAQRPRALTEAVEVLKKAPQPLKQAVVKGEVKVEHAKEAVDLYEEIKKEGGPIEPKRIERHVEELKKEERQAEIQHSLRRELHKEVLTGQKQATDLVMDSAGEDFVIEVKDTAWKVKGWGVPIMMKIGSKHWKEARVYFKQIRDHMDFLLGKSIEEKSLESKTR